MDAATADARRALGLLLSPARAASAAIVPLPGFTNRVYRVRIAGESFALRIPRPGTAAIIDRRVEAANARAAAAIGIAPEVLHFGADGIMLTRFVEGAVPLRPERLRADRPALRRAARALRRLHGSELSFARDFDPFAIAADYLAVLNRLGRRLTDAERGAVEALAPVQAAFAAWPAASKPCHCDPTGGNLLDDGARVWLVDWEYSGMNDPAWDLAYLAIEAGLSPERQQALLTDYLGRAPATGEAARVVAMRPVVEILTALWGLIQHAQGNRVADFPALVERAFRRGTAALREPGFPETLRRLGTL
jgi:thiamine kinase-like enzyme